MSKVRFLNEQVLKAVCMYEVTTRQDRRGTHRTGEGPTPWISDGTAGR